VLLPSNNAVTEGEFAARDAAGSRALHVAHLPADGGGPEDLLRMAANTTAAVAELVEADVDVVLYACVSTSLVAPFGWDAQFARIVHSKSAAVAHTAAEALIVELASLGARRISVVSAYTGAIYEQMPAYFARAGITIEEHATLEIEDIAAISGYDPQDLRRFATERLTSAADALCVVGTDLSTLPVIDDLERDFGVPVVTANGALFAAMRRALAPAETRP
jgi:maleate isomerase